MIFRVAACVLKHEPGPFRKMETGPRKDSLSFDAYKVVFGINDTDVTSAVSLATTALANAADEEGNDLGGVVLEVHAVSVTAEEFEGYNKYFLQPMSLPGIFYASGQHCFYIARSLLAGASEAILGLESGGEIGGRTPTSFVFRRLRVEEGPRVCRLLCPICKSWKEHDSSNLMYSFFDGLGGFDDEKHRLGREAAASVFPFVQQHLQCLRDAGPATAMSGLRFLYEGDEGFDELDQAKEFRSDG